MFHTKSRRIAALIALSLVSGMPAASAQDLYGSRARPARASVAVPTPPATESPNAIEVNSLNESFNDITTLAGAGWILRNQSAPLGSTSWFQGTNLAAGGPFDAFNGAANAYIGANFNNTSGTGTISNWLITPSLDFGNAATFTFYTRTYDGTPEYPDRLEVRLATAGTSTGTSATDVGDFTTLLLSVNPTLVQNVYPVTWTQFTIPTASLPHNGTGRIAFRYFVTNGGITGSNSDYIGIDQVNFSAGTPEYLVGGTVSGLAGSGLTLSLNGGTPVAAANGSFQFTNYVQSGQPYAVTVASQPTNPWQTCAVTNGSGNIGGANVANVQVVCTINTYTVGGTVSGLAGSGLQLSLNGGAPLAIAADGSYNFPAIGSGTAYDVTVVGQPQALSQSCVASNATGTVTNAAVSNVNITCTTLNFTVGGTVSGIAGTVTLEINGGSALPLSANGPYSFAGLPSGTAYNVAVTVQPTSPSQTCVVSNPSGTLTNANVTNVEVSCTTDTFAIGGTVSGLVGSGLMLQINGATNYSVIGNGAYAFTPIADLSTFDVQVLTQPTLPAQTCTVTNGGGTLAGAAITNVDVSCVTDPFLFEVVDGNQQSALFTEAFAETLVVCLRDGAGAPVPGASVTFTTPAGGASATIADGVQTPANALSVLTDAGGNAAVTATANSASGCFNVLVSNAGAPAAASFALFNVNPAPAVFQDGFETPSAGANPVATPSGSVAGFPCQ